MSDEATRNPGLPMLSDMPDVLTVPEVAAALRIGRSSAYRLIAERHLAISIGRRVVVPKTRLLRLLETDASASWTKPRSES